MGRPSASAVKGIVTSGATPPTGPASRSSVTTAPASLCPRPDEPVQGIEPSTRASRARGARPLVEHIARLAEWQPLGVLTLLADVERLDGPVVAHDTGPDLALGDDVLSGTQGARRLLAVEIAVARADRERRRDRDVRKPLGLERALHQHLARIRRAHALAH